MNLLLFEPAEIGVPLPRQDQRAQHLLTVLGRTPGDTFDAGIVNGPRGRGTVIGVSETELNLSFVWGAAPPPPERISLIVGLPRPQTSRDILRDATTMGVAEIHFVSADKADPNYARSALWSGSEWQRHVRAGAEQAFDTRVPLVTYQHSLDEIVASLSSWGTRLALDNYESPAPLGQRETIVLPVTLAFGPERGWSARERDLLRNAGFSFVHLGQRVLRTESAVLAALALVRAKLGLL